MLLVMGSGSGYSLLWQLYKKVITQTCPERLHGLRVDGMNGCSVWSKALQRSHRAVAFLRLLENTTGWLARALLLLWLDGICLQSFTTGLQVTQPSSSVASLCLSSKHCSSEPLSSPSPPCQTYHTRKVSSSGPRPTNSMRDTVTDVVAGFKHFSLSNHISALQNVIFFLRFSPSPSPMAKYLPALTNPVFHLLCFYFLNNCKILNLDLEWKIGFASFVIQKHMAESVGGLPATSGN